MREIRPEGSVLTLGGVDYRLDALEGCGSSAIVYRASYEDSLSSGSRHQVFVKELFPLSRDGSVFRREDGSIAWTEEAGDLMEVSRSRFLMGNRVNLDLLNQSPAGTSGNINSYEAYGTYYSVLSLHGGRNLKDILIQDKKKFSLPETVSVMQRILSALEVFHSQGLLHLDISPDNILLLPEQALLIDYNSVWDTGEAEIRSFAFSEKQGYSPPEVKMHVFRDIGFSTDLFSVCAVFFHLLMGRALRDEELLGSGLRRSLTGDLAAQWEVPQTAAAKAVQILMRGLHGLPRKRYLSVDALREEFVELARRIEGKGITRSALWEASYSLLTARKPDVSHYLPQGIALKNGRVLRHRELYEALGEGGCYLLTGPGGMGKTRALTELWRNAGSRWQPNQPLVLWFSLKEYQQTAGEGQFIRRSILKGLRFSEKDPGYADAMHALERLLDGQKDKAEGGIILLLDGLNEAGSGQARLLQEIEDLGKKPGVGILITDRSDGVLGYALEGFQSGALSPLAEEQIRKELEKTGLEWKPELAKLLSNPMMLFLYIETMASGAAPGDLPDTAEDLVRLYLDSFCRRALREDSGSQGKQLCTRYFLEHLLPEIAAGMQRSRKTVLTFEEICGICDRSYRELSGAAFGNAFPDYRGKSRLMLEGISNAQEWYDLAVNEGLTDRFGLILRTENGYYSLLHDNFQQALADRAEQNRKAVLEAKKKKLIKKLPLLLAGLALLAGMGWGAVRLLGPGSGEVRYTQEEVYALQEGTNCLAMALGKWNGQVTAQEEILLAAESSDILDNRDAQKKDQLAQLIERKEEALSHYPVSPMTEECCAALSALQKKNDQFPLEQFEILCARHEALEVDIRIALDYLRQRLCSEDSLYISLGQQEAMVKAYQNWLEAEAEYVSYELAILLAQLPQEQKEDVWKAMESMDALDGFAEGPGTMPEEMLDRGLQAARSSLKKARDELLTQGFPMRTEMEGEET